MKIDLDGLKDLGNLAEVNNISLYYGDYKLIQFDSPLWQDTGEIEQEWYLMGVNFQKEKGFERKFNSPDILISLINLAEKIISGYGLYDQRGQKDELAFHQDILEWCNKYGLPYYDPYFQGRYYELKGIGGVHAFRIWEFKQRLTKLYDAFQLWYGLAFNEPERVIKSRYTASGLQKDKTIDLQVTHLKWVLAFEVGTKIDTHIRLKYNGNADSFEIEPFANSLVSVAYFQLAMLIANKSENSVRFCSVCGGLFEIEHGNKKICDTCKPEYHRRKTRESRQRSKISKK